METKGPNITRSPIVTRPQSRTHMLFFELVSKNSNHAKRKETEREMTGKEGGGGERTWCFHRIDLQY